MHIEDYNRSNQLINTWLVIRPNELISTISLSIHVQPALNYMYFWKEAHWVKEWNKATCSDRLNSQNIKSRFNSSNNNGHVDGIQSAVLSKNHELKFDSIRLLLLFIVFSCFLIDRYWQSATNQNKPSEYRWNTLSLKKMTFILLNKYPQCE